MKKAAVSSILVAVLLLAVGVIAEAQQPGRIPRIGYVSGTGSPSDPGPYVESLRQGLRDLGYIEGKNFMIEYRGAGENREIVPRLVAELVQLNVDVLVVPIVSAIRAAKQATKTIPIVMVTQVDPVAEGLVDSLARPGGNNHGTRHTSVRLKREAAGIAQGGGSEDFARRNPAGCGRLSVGYWFQKV
jgi:ABC-type uncharacterized transport system substrate-binding protein